MTGDDPARVLVAALVDVGVEPDALTPARPLDQLGIDSFDVLQAIDAVEDELGITIETQALRGLRTVGDLFDAIAGAVAR